MLALRAPRWREHQRHDVGLPLPTDRDASRHRVVASRGNFYFPLHNAAELCSEAKEEKSPAWAIFDLLLARGADPKQRDERGRDALLALFYNFHSGCLWGDGPPMGRIEQLALKLMALGCDPFPTESTLFGTPEEGAATCCFARLGIRSCVAALPRFVPLALHLAAKHEHWDIVGDLLARGLTVDDRGPDGKTALHTTTWMMKTAAAVELLKRGADPNLTIDDRGRRVSRPTSCKTAYDAESTSLKRAARSSGLHEKAHSLSYLVLFLRRSGNQAQFSAELRACLRAPRPSRAREDRRFLR